MRRRIVLLAAGLATSLVTGFASASPSFPPIVQEVARAPSNPDCLLCHTSPSGGFGTADTPFATYLKSRGLEPGDEGSLRGALQAMIEERHDTDGDGTTDAAEIEAGDDPNGNSQSEVGRVVYGCGGARIAPSATLSTSPWLFCAVVLFASLRRALRRANRNAGGDQ